MNEDDVFLNLITQYHNVTLCFTKWLGLIGKIPNVHWNQRSIEHQLKIVSLEDIIRSYIKYHREMELRIRFYHNNPLANKDNAKMMKRLFHEMISYPLIKVAIDIVAM